MHGVPRQLAEWFAQRGHSLKPSNTYAVHERTVYYRPGDPRQTRLAYLLHEAGHVLCGRCMQTTRFLDGYYHPRTGRGRSYASAVDLVHEEIEAWHRGFALAQRMGLRVNETVYWRTYGRAILSYMRSAVRRKL